MIIYKDILTGDELISDSFDLKEVGDALYEVDCAMMTVGGDSFDIGANASAEGGGDDEGVEDGQEQVNNVVHSFRLQKIAMDKAGYKDLIKPYMKKVTKKLQDNGTSDDEIKKFQAGAAAFAKKVLGNFGDYDCYLGESQDPEGMVALLNYREDGTTPFFTFWKHGLTGMKV